MKDFAAFIAQFFFEFSVLPTFFFLGSRKVLTVLISM